MALIEKNPVILSEAEGPHTPTHKKVGWSPPTNSYLPSYRRRSVSSLHSKQREAFHTSLPKITTLISKHWIPFCNGMTVIAQKNPVILSEAEGPSIELTFPPNVIFGLDPKISFPFDCNSTAE